MHMDEFAVSSGKRLETFLFFFFFFLLEPNFTQSHFETYYAEKSLGSRIKGSTERVIMLCNIKESERNPRQKSGR